MTTNTLEKAMLGGVVPYGNHRVVAVQEVVKDVDGGRVLEGEPRIREGGGELGVWPVVVDDVEGVGAVVRVAEDGQAVSLEHTEGILLRVGRQERWERWSTGGLAGRDDRQA